MIECRRSQWLSYHISKSQLENNEKSILDNVFIQLFILLLISKISCSILIGFSDETMVQNFTARGTF